MDARMKFDDLMKKDVSEIITLIAATNRNNGEGLLEVTDSVSYTDIAPLMKKLKDDGIHVESLHFYIRKDEYNRDYTFFNLEVTIPDVGTLCIETDWSVWQWPNVQYISEYVLCPIYEYGFGDTFMVEGIQIETPKHALDNIILKAQQDLPEQFRYQEQADPTSEEFLAKQAHNIVEYLDRVA